MRKYLLIAMVFTALASFSCSEDSDLVSGSPGYGANNSSTSQRQGGLNVSSTVIDGSSTVYDSTGL